VTAPAAGRATSQTPGTQAALAAYGELPLSFIENRGQVDGDVAYYAVDAAAVVYFTREGMVIGPTGRSVSDELRVAFAGAAPAAIESLGRAPGVVNYYGGADRRRWFEGVPTHAGVRYVAP